MEGINKYLKRAVIDVEYFVNSGLIVGGNNGVNKENDAKGG